MAPARAKRTFSRGFTLIELLVVTAILGLVTGVLAACIAGGIRVWEHARSFNTVEAQAMLALRIVEKDLRNAFPFYAIPFRCDARELVFPGWVAVDRDGSPAGSRVGTVRYAFDQGRKTLLRSAWPFPDADPGIGSAERILSEVEAVQWEVMDDAAAEARADGGVSLTGLPLRVSVRVALTDPSGRSELGRTVVLPLARPAGGEGTP